MKTKIIDEYFDNYTGISRVKIQNKYGHFTGFAHYNKEKEEEGKDLLEHETLFSCYQGARIALVRAHIKFAKSRLKEEKIKLKAIKNLLKNIYHDEDFDIETYKEKTYQRAKKEKERYEKEIEL